MSEFITIGEYAKREHITRYEAYQRAKEMNTERIKGVLCVEIVGEDEAQIKLDIPQEEQTKEEQIENAENPIEKQKENEKTVEMTADNATNDYYIQEIKRLNDIISKKDEIIAKKDEQIVDFTNRLFAIVNQSNAIAENALNTTSQAHLLQAIDKKTSEKRQGLLSRLFNKNKDD